jgi:hypothetical protein
MNDGTENPDETRYEVQAARQMESTLRHTASAPAGWYTDPDDPSIRRYWDGAAWTGSTSSLQVAVEAPSAASERLTLLRVLAAFGVACLVYIPIVARQAANTIEQSTSGTVYFPIWGVIATVVLAVLAGKQGNRRYTWTGVVLTVGQVAAILLGYTYLFG